MQDTVLELQDIRKAFGTKQIHRGVNLSLKKGEIHGLLGGSGTGKSVILRSCIGLERPDSGRILFEEKDLTKMRENDLFSVRRKIAYVFQNGALFDSLTVEENLAYPLEEHTSLSESDILERVNEMLELMDLKGTNELLPSELSGGMQKRAGLARAIILNPEVILFDEPTAGLDPINTKRLIGNIAKLRDRGITGIFVTHDIPAIMSLADRISILHQGEIKYTDTPDNMRDSPDPIVQAFIAGEFHRD